MDRYQASIDGVDSALSRLNHTMAACRISKSWSSSTDAPASTDGNPRTSAQPPNAARQASLSLRGTSVYPEDISGTRRLERLREACALIADEPYCLVTHLFIAIEYLGLGYPDLAAGSAYKALLLSDALDDEAEEYHPEALEALARVITEQPLQERIQLLRRVVASKDEEAWSAEPDPELDIEAFHWLGVHYRLLLYRVFIHALVECGSFRSAHSYLQQALRLYPEETEFQDRQVELPRLVAEHVHDAATLASPTEWPDKSRVRRELYPWNSHEPDRLRELPTLNRMMQAVAPHLEVRAVELPSLAPTPGGGGDGDDPPTTSTQLGVFATEDLPPGCVILDETSLLTANNRLQDTLCDACSADLPALGTPGAESVVACPDCAVAVYCSETCRAAAAAHYHPALCDREEVAAIAKEGVAPADAADALYALLLLRALALAATRGVHPLEIQEVKYIWGDFTPGPPRHPSSSPAPSPSSSSLSSERRPPLPRTLPFSFEHNVRLPFHMLEKMDVDIFAHPAAEVWVFNTLYAKFRGTASARLSGAGGRGPVRGPEVSAVHPLWCLANHSCDPNVRWDWGGSVRFEVREERVEWKRPDLRPGEEAGEREKGRASVPGIRKGEEVLNHYCDIDLPVQDRREWARGALGGDCRCERCKWEARETS